MPSTSSYITARKKHNAAKEKDIAARRIKAINAAATLLAGNPVPGWELLDNNQTLLRRRARSYRIKDFNQLDLSAKIHEIKEKTALRLAANPIA
jgi:hypothetical protein